MHLPESVPQVGQLPGPRRTTGLEQREADICFDNQRELRTEAHFPLHSNRGVWQVHWPSRL